MAYILKYFNGMTGKVLRLNIKFILTWIEINFHRQIKQILT